MKNSITTQILVQGKHPKIEQTLESVQGTRILIGDLGADADVLGICKKYGEIIKVSGDFSGIRNQLTEYGGSEWNFYIQPWETLAIGSVKELSRTSYLQIYENDVIIKEIRFWHKSQRFNNPIFETIHDDTAEINLDVILFSSGGKYAYSAVDWIKKSPNLAEPYYYDCCIQLNSGNFKEFLRSADKFFFLKKKKDNSSLMLSYYVAMVRLYKYSWNVSDILTSCLEQRPLMAEFWCLLGDNALKMGEVEKACAFYENAIVLGKHKLNDLLPIEISKYKSYPEEMIKKCINGEVYIKNKPGLATGFI